MFVFLIAAVSDGCAGIGLRETGAGGRHAVLSPTPRVGPCPFERVWVDLVNAVAARRLPERLPHDYAPQWQASKLISHSVRFVMKPFSLLFIQ